MKYSITLLRILTICFLISLSIANIFPGERWHSGRIDLGNGEDNIFYILYKSRDKNPKAPLLLYMAGGPGTSGEFNILLENGPYIVNDDAKFVRNEYAWNNNYDLLFIDQPVGVGFSITNNKNNYCKNRLCVVENVFRFLLGFYEENPEYKGRPFYISGVSYAGHYVPGVSAHLIRKAHPDINFKGAIIGGPWIDAEVQMFLDPYYLYVNGKFNIFQYLLYTFGGIICKILVMIDRTGAYEICSAINDVKDDSANLTNGMNIKSNVTYEKIYRKVIQFWNSPVTQKELGVYPFKYVIKNRTAGSILRRYDWLINYSEEIAFILDKKYSVTLMHGDLDYTCQYYGGLATVEKMNWYGKQKFLKAKWVKVGNYSERKLVDKFTFYKVYGAGHLIPRDQPVSALKLLDKFIKNNP